MKNDDVQIPMAPWASSTLSELDQKRLFLATSFQVATAMVVTNDGEKPKELLLLDVEGRRSTMEQENISILLPIDFSCALVKEVLDTASHVSSAVLVREDVDALKEAGFEPELMWRKLEDGRSTQRVCTTSAALEYVGRGQGTTEASRRLGDNK
jgi:hypothetical protein